MLDLDQALAEITAIRTQIVRSAEFRGYGPATVAITGLLALVVAAAQARLVPHPARDFMLYLELWIASAALSATLIGFEMVTRSQRAHSRLADEMMWTAVAQFLPAAAAGVLLTAVLVLFAPATLWMIPGLWQIIFSLGVFASCRFLPRASYGVGAWYLATGLACLIWARDANAFSPWGMGLPFGFGEVLAAAVLYLNVEQQVGQKDGLA